MNREKSVPADLASPARPRGELQCALELVSRAEKRPRLFHRDPTLQALAAELRRARARAGMTQREVASLMWSAQSAVSRLERGRLTRPSLSTIEKYALAVGCSVEIRLRSPWPD